MLSDSIERSGKTKLFDQFKDLETLIRSKNALNDKDVDEFVNDNLETMVNTVGYERYAQVDNIVSNYENNVDSNMAKGAYIVVVPRCLFVSMFKLFDDERYEDCFNLFINSRISSLECSFYRTKTFNNILNLSIVCLYRIVIFFYYSNSILSLKIYSISKFIEQRTSSR